MGELLKALKKQNSSELTTKWENIGFLSDDDGRFTCYRSDDGVCRTKGVGLGLGGRRGWGIAKC